MSAANDYGPVAHLYDVYVQADFDLDFLQTEVARARGPVLELTAGTGRVSSRLVGSCSELTCVDISPEMLRLLIGKVPEWVNRPRVVCADLRALPLPARYTLALLPFNAFSELVDLQDERRALREMHRVLVTGGHLILTLHNPRIRAKAMSDAPRRLGSYSTPQGSGRFEVWIRESLERETGIAQATQTYRFYDADGRVESERIVPLRFRLIERESFKTMAVDAGFEVVELFGDYDRSGFQAETSPYMIWSLRKGGYRQPTVPT